MKWLPCLVFLVGCSTVPPAVFDAMVNEYAAYQEYLSAEVKSGRMTSEHSNYLLKQKESEIVHRAQSYRRQGTVTYTPVRPVQPLPRSTSCRTTVLGGVMQTDCN